MEALMCNCGGRQGKNTNINIVFQLATTIFGEHEPKNLQFASVQRILDARLLTNLSAATMPSHLTLLICRHGEIPGQIPKQGFLCLLSLPDRK